MSWAKIDDRANENRKLLEAGAEACWLWTCGLMYANRQQARDGFIPELALGILYPFKSQPKKLAARLVEAGLWVRTEKGYQIHQYHQWNPTAEAVEAERAAGRARAAKSYAARAGSSPPSSVNSSGEDQTNKRVSSGVEWSGTGQGLGDLDPDPEIPESGGSLGARDPESLVSAAKTWLLDPQRAALTKPNPHKWPDSLRLVAVLAEVFGGKAQPIRASGDPRMAVLLRHWADGRTTDELERAIRGAGSDDHLRRNPQLQTLTTVLRDAGQVDRFTRLLDVEPVSNSHRTSDRAADQLGKQQARIKAFEELERLERDTQTMKALA